MTQDLILYLTIINKMELRHRIELLRNELGMSKAAFARHLGLANPQVIQDLTSGKTKSISNDVRNRIISCFPNINLDWLLTGEGEMLKDSPDNNIEEVETTTKEELETLSKMKVHIVPLIPTAALANSLSEYLGPGIKRTDCQNIVSPVPGAEFAITVSGDSMEPKFHDGMIVFLKRINEEAFIPWGHTVILDTENGAFIKNIFPDNQNDSYIWAKSINPQYPPMHIPKASIFHIFRVLGTARIFTTM